MDISITPITKADEKPIIDIFNYYVQHSFAAYAEHLFPYEAFPMLLHQSNGYPSATLKTLEGRIIGFGFLRFYNPLPTFNGTAELTAFIHHEYTGKGIGKHLLRYLEKEGEKMGIENILVNISSLNRPSLKFHEKNGFKRCGRMRNICRKKGALIDVIWMQKALG